MIGGKMFATKNDIYRLEKRIRKLEQELKNETLINELGAATLDPEYELEVPNHRVKILVLKLLNYLGLDYEISSRKDRELIIKKKDA